MDEKYAGLREGISELERVEFAILDLETTGLDVRTDEIISISIIPMIGLQIHFGRYFHSLIKPKKFHERSIKIHGICPGDLEKAPAFEEIYERIFDMLNKRIVAGFNIFFDVAFLKEKSKKIVKNHHKKLDLNYVDIKEVEMLILRRTGTLSPRSFDFSELIHKYQIEEVLRHSALSDAYAAARIFQKQLNILLDFNITLNDLIQISRVLRIF